MIYGKNVLKDYLESLGLEPTFKNFYQLDLSEVDFYGLIDLAQDWKDERKRLLQHKDCPKEYLRNIAKHHELWYVRLVAIFSKHYRDEFYSIAANDSDTRVRRAYYRHLLNREMNEHEYNKIMREIELDGKVRVYFNTERI